MKIQGDNIMVTIQELKDIFTTVFGEEIDVSDIDENSDLKKDIGMNSISFLYTAMVLEEKYSIQFNNDDFVKLTTVRDVIDVIESKVQGK